MSSNRSKVAVPIIMPQGDAKEKEEDMFVLISRRNPWKDGKLVSSSDNPPAAGTQSTDKGKGTVDKDGWETIPLHGGNSDQSSRK
ncbi:hypothetical protein E0Z10_g4951 [Xylaria hypoxylon]|uniref:Uncharacterized protein n=1 Tax=Xylaria hypoxylon TaxID=37992 RepID=A0A4Z0YJW9_9PEZI|nr:hypothetical protein E0Z10_g4951 [Xylaria hypoxylon]